MLICPFWQKKHLNGGIIMVTTKISSLVVPLLTPMNEDFSIDYFGLKNLVAKLSNKGVRDFFVLGPYSEADYLSYSEHKQIISSVAKEIKNKGNLFVACFSDSSDEIVEKIKFAEKHADYCVINIPFSALTSRIEFFDFFDKIFTKTKAKIIIFNNPKKFKRNIPMSGLNEIAGWEKFVSVFDNSSNMSYFRALSDFHQLISLYQCDELKAVESFNYKCSGTCLGLSNIIPELFINLKKEFEAYGYPPLVKRELRIATVLDKFPKDKLLQAYKLILSEMGIIQSIHSELLESLSESEKKSLQELVKIFV
jgi:dihydrodipicolinate synthase/N-acetylneuraminate lyase